jgi:hypothetical protein
MSLQLEEDQRTIEDLKRKMHELSSLGKHTVMDADISVKAQSSQCSKVNHLKNNLTVEKLRAKYTKQKYKFEASCYSILGHKLGSLKIGFVQLLQRFDVLDASFLPVPGSTHDQTKVGYHFYIMFELFLLFSIDSCQKHEHTQTHMSWFCVFYL